MYTKYVMMGTKQLLVSNKWSLTSDFFGGSSENFSEEALLVEEASEDEDLED